MSDREGPWIDPGATAMLRAFLGRKRARPREASGASRDPMFRRSGSSFDLKSIRDYQNSDDPRRIDWRLAARSGRLSVKEYYDEEREGIAILVDLSASVRIFGPSDPPPQGQTPEETDEVPKRLAATMAWLAGALGLPVTVLPFSSRPMRRFERPRGGPAMRPIESFFDGLKADGLRADGFRTDGSRTEGGPEGPTDIGGAVNLARATTRHRRLLLISDFLDSRFRPTASPFRLNAFVRLHRPFDSLFRGALELEVTDPETGLRLRMPWDRVSEEAYRERERALEAELGEAARRGAFCGTIRPRDDRSRVYWDFLEALHA